MGTEIEGNSKGYGYYSMRDVNNNNNNEQSSGNNWPMLCGDKSLPSSNGEYVVNGFSLVGFDRNTLRQTMLEHEAIFKRQLVELHCLYKIQRDMMEEARRKDIIHKHRTTMGMMMMIPQEASSSSSPFSAWNSPLSCSNKGGGSLGSKDCEILDHHRPSKVRKRLFDLQFNGNEEEEEECLYDVLDYPSKGSGKGFVFLADLNEPTQAEETESISCQIEAKSKSEFLHRLSKETSRRRNEEAIRSSNGRGGDWSMYNSDAEHYRNHLNSSSSSRDAIQTLGFLQSEQRRELHGRKHNPFNHKIDWSQSWGNSNQTSLHTNSSLYSSRQLTTTHETLGDKWRVQGPISNLCFTNPLANNNNNGFYRGSSSGYKDALAYVSPNEDGGRKQDDHPRLPSWLKPKNPNSAETSFQQSLPAPAPPLRKIVGFTSKEESSSLASTSASLQPTRELIDINVAYYDPEPEEQENKKVRTHIDLNSCITEEEEEEVAIEPVKSNLLVLPKVSMEIDLEAPPLLLPEEEEEEENVRSAAEAIVLISVSGDCGENDENNSMEDPLGWFAEIVVPCSTCEETMDYFEAVTLSLPEMKAEEYMPKELIMIGNNSDEEEGGGNVVNNNNNNKRSRRSRRGKQRRDFQRDILPGLVSLSRHEVSQDIQTFSGLMKATGHTWVSPRRGGGGGGRGRRRRSVVELPPTAPAEEEEEEGGHQSLQASEGRSLTVWGKTLRRPRRQRRLDSSSSTSNLNPITTTIISIN
ncbi:uncharacterized protein LOC124922424 [Impatiens glandulifera]|uniref:uncharacterized protein LOC124922424 n=1 Tax=Impatiens glandulifera TaxID=253017 RepID=UPI001FB0FE51|nr:uncharacterized protein LOC124922424 [Impatiens glandulifera]